MTQVSRNAKYLETNKKARLTLVVDSSTQELKQMHGFTHTEIYEAGLKYLIELKGKLQQI